MVFQPMLLLKAISFQVGLTIVHPQLTMRVEELIARCWQEGEGKIVDGKKVKSHLKVSVEAVQSRLAAQYEEGQLRLSEVPVVGQLRAVYQHIGQSKSSLQLPKKRGKKSSDGGSKFQKVCRLFGEIQWGSVDLNLLKVNISPGIQVEQIRQIT